METEWSRERLFLWGRWFVVLAGTAISQVFIIENPHLAASSSPIIGTVGIFAIAYLIFSTLTFMQIPYRSYHYINLFFVLSWSLFNVYLTQITQKNTFAILILWVIFENVLKSPLRTGIYTTLAITNLYSLVIIITRLSSSYNQTVPWSDFILMYLSLNIFGIVLSLSRSKTEEHEGAKIEKYSTQIKSFNELLEEAYKTAKKLSESLKEQEKKFGDMRRRFQAIAEASNTLGTIRNPDELQKILLKKTREEMNTEGSFIFFIRDDKLERTAWEGLSEAHLKLLESPRGEGPLGNVSLWGGFLNLREDEISRQMPIADQTVGKLKNILCVALKTIQDEMPFGILGVANLYEKEEFDNNDEIYLRTLAMNASIALKNAQLVHDLQQSYDEIVLALAQAIEAKDPYTRGHVSRVRMISLQIANAMNLPESQKGIIEQAAILHDVGKISTPDEILLKPGALNSEERQKMESHAIASKNILSGIKSLNPTVLELIIHHHERFDGDGYPEGLRGNDIPLGAQILAVADTYDALTSDRPYRAGIPHEKAMKLIAQCAGTQFNPKVIHSFFSLF